MGVTRKCLLLFCKSEPSLTYSFCGEHTVWWTDSPEYKRVMAPRMAELNGDEYSAQFGTALGDFTRRVEAEYLNRRKDG